MLGWLYFFFLLSPLLICMPGVYVLSLPHGVSHLSLLHSSLISWSHRWHGVAFIECFYVKVNRICPSLLQLCPLGLSHFWHHHRSLQNLFLLVPLMNCLALHSKTVIYLNCHYYHFQSRSLSLVEVSDMAWCSIDENWMWAIEPCLCFFFWITSTMCGLYPYCISYSMDSRICEFKWWCNIDTIYAGLVVIYKVSWCRQRCCVTFWCHVIPI